MKTYDKFLDYYESIVRSVNNPIEDEIDFLNLDCIREYKPETKTILETACGTGVVAKELNKLGYKVTGLDISENMLKKAEKNLNKKDLVLADMTDFNLNKKFDAVLCNYNSICHLLKWEDWQNFLEKSSNHLDKDGLLIFDIVTVFEFENIVKEFAQFYNFDEDTVCLEMFKEDGVYKWLVKMYIKSDDGRYDLVEEIVKEMSFPISKIEKELKEKGFKLLEKVDYHYGEVTAKSERVYFICRKK